MKLQKLFIFFLAGSVLFVGALSFFRGDLFVAEKPMPSESEGFISRENAPAEEKQEEPSLGQSAVPSSSGTSSETTEESPRQQQSDKKQVVKAAIPARQLSSLLGEGVPLFEGTTPPDENGRFYDQVVVRTDKKYPLLIQQDIYELSDNDSGGVVARGQRLFVADHVVVRVKEGYETRLVESNLEKIDMAVRKKMNDSGLYLVEFPVKDFDSWNKAVEVLKSQEMIQAVTPDIFSQTLR